MLSVVIPHTGEMEKLTMLFHSGIALDHFDIILVFDGYISCDNYTIVQQKFPKYRHFNTGRKNSGAGFARNIGLRESKGDWIVFCDSDDVINWVELTKISSKLNKNIDIFLTYPKSFIDDDIENLGKRHLKYEKMLNAYELDSQKSSLHSFVVPWSKIYNKSFLVINRLSFQEITASNDVLFSIKVISSANLIRLLNKNFYNVREHRSSLTRNDNYFRILERYHSLKSANRFFQSYGVNFRFVVTMRIRQMFIYSPKIATKEFFRSLFETDKVIYTAPQLMQGIIRYSRIFNTFFKKILCKK